MAASGLDVVCLFNHQNDINQMMAGIRSCEETGLNLFPAYSLHVDPDARYSYPGSWAPIRAQSFFNEMKSVFSKH